MTLGYQMIPNFVSQLQNELGNSHTISQSPDSRFDLQIRLNKLIDNSELFDSIKSNESINKTFDTEQIITTNGIFVCFAIKKSLMINILNELHQSQNVMPTLVENPRTIIYDYSSPNMSKDMHVGHLRSTIIGDALANVSEYLGHNVIRLNHVGDFGLPFGMIVEYVIKNGSVCDNLQQLYLESRELFKTSDEFAQKVYNRTTLLQNKSDPLTNSTWQEILNVSMDQYQHIYQSLNISPKLVVKGESFYVDYIDQCKKLLEDAGLVENNDGRILVKCDEPLNSLTYIKSKEKGNAYTYDTTDIVALWYRTCVMNVDEIYYVVDTRQTEHFKQIFNVGKKMNWLNNKKVQHIQFGTILGKDGRPLQSRFGGTPRLIDLIDESIEKTREQFKSKEKNINDFEYEINSIAICSLKYQDYSKCRTSDYKFNSDLMVKFDKNTFTFLSYTISRIRGINDHINKNNLSNVLSEHIINHDELCEIDFNVIRKIMQYNQVLEMVDKTKMIHTYIDFLSKLCEIFNSNYSNSRYLNFDCDGKLINYNLSKLAMCQVVMNVLQTSCKLLGLNVVDVM